MSMPSRFGTPQRHKTNFNFFFDVFRLFRRVHKAVFVSRSTPLALMMSSTFREATSNVVEFPTLSVDCFVALRRFMYTGDLQVNSYIIEEMVMLTKKRFF